MAPGCGASLASGLRRARIESRRCGCSSRSGTGRGSPSRSSSSSPRRPTRRGWTGSGCSEAWGQDAVSILAVLADRTERIHLGSALMQIPARPPTTAAMAAATIDVISGGRFRMGLGVSGPQVSEGWYGVPFTRPLSRTREYVEIVRKVWAREVVEYEGREFQLPATEGIGLGKPLKLMIKPVQEELPIYLGAIGPKAIEQTGRDRERLAAGLLQPLRLRPAARALRPRARQGRPRTSATSTWPRWSPSRSRRTSRPRARPCARSSPSTSAAWAPRARTSTSTSATTTATATRRARSRTASSPATGWARSAR